MKRTLPTDEVLGGYEGKYPKDLFRKSVVARRSEDTRLPSSALVSFHKIPCPLLTLPYVYGIPCTADTSSRPAILSCTDHRISSLTIIACEHPE